MIRSGYLGCKMIFEALFLSKNVSFSWFFASLNFFVKSPQELMNFEKIQFMSIILVQMTPNFYTTCGQVKKSNWDQKNANFFIFADFCHLACEKASGINLAGVLPPRLNFDSANLRKIKNPEDWRSKIHFFRLKIFCILMF